MGTYTDRLKAIKNLEEMSMGLRVKCANFDIEDSTFADKKGRRKLADSCAHVISEAEALLTGTDDTDLQLRLRDIISRVTDYKVRLLTPPTRAPFAESP